MVVGDHQVRSQGLREELLRCDGLAVGELIGRGGQRVVFAGEYDGQRCALKVSPASERERIEREIALAKTFNHPCLVQILVDDPWELTVGDTALLAFVEDLIDGETLTVPATPQDSCAVLEMCEDLWSALEHLAERNVVHRDLSPKNVMRRRSDERPRYVLLDVGIARHLDLVGITSTHLAGPGTARYAAPEQFDASRSKQVDWRTDLFSLGILAYEQLTTSLPYNRDTEGAHTAWLEEGGVPANAPIEQPWSKFLNHLLHRRQFGRPRRDSMPELLMSLRRDLLCS